MPSTTCVEFAWTSNSSVEFCLSLPAIIWLVAFTHALVAQFRDEGRDIDSLYWLNCGVGMADPCWSSQSLVRTGWLGSELFPSRCLLRSPVVLFKSTSGVWSCPGSCFLTRFLPRRRCRYASCRTPFLFHHFCRLIPRKGRGGVSSSAVGSKQRADAHCSASHLAVVHMLLSRELRIALDRHGFGRCCRTSRVLEDQYFLAVSTTGALLVLGHIHTMD
jgi:hypothetical protein